MLRNEHLPCLGLDSASFAVQKGRSLESDCTFRHIIKPRLARHLFSSAICILIPYDSMAGQALDRTRGCSKMTW